MTTGTGDSGVSAGQLEDGVGMIKSAWLPAIGGVTGCALSAKRAAMRIIAGMARGAGSRRADKEFILMALSTCHCSMFTRQLET